MRPAPKLALYTTIGAILTWITAWCSALPTRAPTTRMLGVRAINYTRPDGQQASGACDKVWYAQSWELMNELVSAFDTPAQPPSWVPRPRPSDIATITDAYGFPLPCLSTTRTLYPPPNHGLVFKVQESTTGDLNLTLLNRPVKLPTHVIPLNFALNTTLTALLLFGLVEAVAALRRLRRNARARHQRCPWCNYDRRGLAPPVPCPECGRA